MNGIGIKNLLDALSNSLTPGFYQGTVQAGGRMGGVVSFDDTVGGFVEDGQWFNYYVQFSPNTKSNALRGLWFKISWNDSFRTIYLANGTVAPVAGDTYTIRQLLSNGTDATGVTAPAGATGMRGWLSAIFNLIFSGTGMLRASAPALTGVLNVPNQLNATIALGSLSPAAGAITDVCSVTMAIANVGTAQTITAASLVLSDVVDGQNVSITYPLTGVNIASGSASTFTVPLNQGIYKNVAVNVTFAIAPAAIGRVTVLANAQGPGSPQMTLTGSSVIDVILQDAVVAPGNGTPFIVGGYKTLTFEVFGTSASRTVMFEGLSISGAWISVMCVNVSTNASASQTTGTGEVWQADVTGLVQFRTRLSAVAGGNVSSKGKAAA